jgi:hypothetical protein
MPGPALGPPFADRQREGDRDAGGKQACGPKSAQPAQAGASDRASALRRGTRSFTDRPRTPIFVRRFTRPLLLRAEVMTGFEPVTQGVLVPCSIQMSYINVNTKGLEPHPSGPIPDALTHELYIHPIWLCGPDIRAGRAIRTGGVATPPARVRSAGNGKALLAGRADSRQSKIKDYGARGQTVAFMSHCGQVRSSYQIQGAWPP